MNYLIRFNLLVSICLLVSCSSINVHMDYDDHASFKQLKTYSWLPGQPKNSGNEILDSNELLHDRIKQAINLNLSNSGYVLVSPDKADFLIGYYIVTEQKTRITVINDYYGYPRGWGYYGRYYNYAGGSRTYVYDYELGTLIIDIVNTQTHKLMWRGTAQDEIKQLKTPEQKKAKIAEVVKKTLALFPPDIKTNN